MSGCGDTSVLRMWVCGYEYAKGVDRWIYECVKGVGGRKCVNRGNGWIRECE